MRAVLSLRFLAAVAALVGLTLGLNALVDDDDDIVDAVEEELAPPTRQIDLIALVESFESSPDFEVSDDGVTVGFVDMVLDETRVVRVAPGTPGEINCANLRNTNRCVLLADMFGDAVIWFAVEPRGPNDTVVLGPITDLRDGYAIFENGWEIEYPPVIERVCADELDITSFSDFLRRFGPNSTSIVDLETRQVSEVVCGEEVVPTTTDPDTTTGTTVGASAPDES